MKNLKIHLLLIVITTIFVGFVACKNPRRQNVNVTTIEEGQTDATLRQAVVTERIFPKDSLIKEIRKEFNRIENASLKEDKRYYADTENMIYARYSGYYDGNELVKLQMRSGEGPYGFTYTFYLKDSQLFFVYIISEEQDVEETQKRIYLNKGKIFEALIKTGTPPIDAISNNPDTQYLDNIEESSQSLLKLYDKYLKEYESSEPETSGR